ncbi:MAG TPA: hypothetical protein VHL58_17310 [Thermoanaerobaculia bacterium]|nr:hypothetical protein [Thermoanaerobaculia bacterium]
MKFLSSAGALIFTTMLASTASAAGPEIVSYHTEQSGAYPLPINVLDTSAGIQAVVGLNSQCVVGSNSFGITSLVVNLNANDGGYVTFRYRLRACGGTSLNSGDLALPGSPTFANLNALDAGIRPPGYNQGNLSVKRAEDWTPGTYSRDTGWIEATMYVPPWSLYHLDYNELVIATGTVGPPAYAEIADLGVMCGSSPVQATAAVSQTLKTLAPTPGQTPFMRHRQVSALREIPVLKASAGCRGCCVAPLTPPAPNDNDSAVMEQGYDAWFWLKNLVPQMQTATYCFKDAVTNAGGRFSLISTYRTAWYQLHFSEIWNKAKELNKDTRPECAILRDKVLHEKNVIHGINYEPAKGINPRHVNGEAIDVQFKPAKTGISDATLITTADGCDLYRRLPQDREHFEHK